MKKRKITTYLVFAFALAWIIWGILALLGVDLGSKLAGIVLPISMFAPTVAVLITKLFNRETRIMGTSFKPKFRGHIRWYLIAWLLPIALVFIGEFLSYCVFPDSFDAKTEALRSSFALVFPGSTITSGALLSFAFVNMLLVMTANVIVGMLLTFGEEVGWRGFLFPEVRSRTTEVKSHIICGTIWGLWHAPVIAMGYNFGIGYWGFPWLGILVLCPLSVSMGIFLSHLTRKSGSIWPAVLAHSAVNTVSGVLYAVFLRKDYSASANTTFISYVIRYVIPYLLFGIPLLIVLAQKNKGKYNSLAGTE